MRTTTTLLLLAASLLATTTALAADPSAPLAGVPPGTRLRIVTHNDIETTGSLVEVDGDVLTLATSGSPVKIRAGDVRRAEQSRGRKGSPLKGAAIGAGIGAVLAGAVPESYWEESCYGCRAPSRAEAAFAGAFAGGLWGLLVGHLVKHDEWRPVDVSTWSVAVAPAPQGAGVRLALRW